MVDELTKMTVLEENLIHRKNEVLMYDINIENYQRMLVEIDNLDADDDDEVNDAIYREHRERLAHLLKTEKIERAKAYLALRVIESQVNGE